ncbi:MAG: cell wall-active antibiotics response protein [Oscillospiraceae bacterium]|nr:cell wall-active antibiotics response protein [Oscillospiraceae bacterium]
MRKKITLVLFGVCLIVGASLYFLSELEIIPIAFNGWWAMLIIVPALADMVARKVQIWNVLLLIFGVWLFMSQQNWDWLNPRVMDALVILLIAVALGLLLIARALRKPIPPANVWQQPPQDFQSGQAWQPQHGAPPAYTSPANPATDNNPRPDYSAYFSTNAFRSECPALENVQSVTIFGGSHADLTSAGFYNNSVVNVTAVFGNVEIVFPQNVNVYVEATTPFSTVNNQIRRPFDESLPTVTVKCFAMFSTAQVR